MARPTGPPSSRVLLVEGPNDRHVVWHVWARHAAESPFCIVEKGGVDKLLEAIVPELKVSGRQAVGILLDANTTRPGVGTRSKVGLRKRTYPFPSACVHQALSLIVILALACGSCPTTRRRANLKTSLYR